MAEELPNLPMYCSVEWADAFFSSFLWTENWDSMEEKQKTSSAYSESRDSVSRQRRKNQKSNQKFREQ